MKKLLVAILVMGAFNATAASYGRHNYGPFDFDLQQRVMVTLSGFASAEDAVQAAVSTIADIEAGDLMSVNKKMRYIGDDGECKSLWNNWNAEAVGEFIAARGQYAKVELGFTLGTSYDSQGNASVSAKIAGRIPCLNPQSDDD